MQKAISAIIATIMLLMISVSLIGVFYVFSSTMATQTTSSGSAQVSQLTSQLSMCMQIRNIYGNHVTLENCGKGVIENKSLVVTIDDIKLGASTQTITEGNSSVVNISGLWQIPFGTHSLKISNGAAVAQNLVDVQPNKDGLVGLWNFNEGSGAVANDGSGNGNSGTLLPSDSEPTWVNGKFNKGLQFDGANDYVETVGSSNYLDGIESSVAFWVRFPTTANANYLVTKQQIGAGGFVVGRSNQKILFDYYSRVTWSWHSLETAVLSWNANTWYHIVATRGPAGMRIYRDGILLGSNDDTTVFVEYGVAPIRIGGHPSYGGYYNVTIDEVRIWNSALTPDETVTMKQII